MIISLIEKINGRINGIVWGFPTIVLILLTGIVITCGTGFFQVRGIKIWLKATVGSLFKRKSPNSKSSKNKNQMSAFQSACTALAATIGTGNIAGVATAIAIGGPGAVFWMWVSAFFGMMTAYAENVLGIYSRCKNEYGQWCGGPMYYIGEGVKFGNTGKILAVMFSLFCIFASFGIGNMTQANSIASAMKLNFGADELRCGIVVAVFAGTVVVGGVNMLGRVTEKLVPLMSLFYIGASLFIIISNAERIPAVMESIVSNAFGFAPVAGGGCGVAMKKAVFCGIRRGVFSNEAGLGSSVIVNSASDICEPAEQGMWGMFEVFFDTFVLCSMTAFVLLTTCCDAITVEEALKGITEEKRTVALSDSGMLCNTNGIALMGTCSNSAIKTVLPYEKDAVRYTVYPASGEPFDIFCKREYGENSHTNIMTVRGVSVDSKSGKIKNSGDINAVVFEKIEGVQLVTYAFSGIFGGWAGKILAIAILFFAFSTLIGWSYYGTKAWEYLFGLKTVAIYKIVFVAFIVLGATLNLNLAWEISDTLNGLMALPNLVGVLSLSGKVLEITRNYFTKNTEK